MDIECLDIVIADYRRWIEAAKARKLTTDELESGLAYWVRERAILCAQ